MQPDPRMKLALPFRRHMRCDEANSAVSPMIWGVHGSAEHSERRPGAIRDGPPKHKTAARVGGGWRAGEAVGDARQVFGAQGPIFCSLQGSFTLSILPICFW
jgi:hypothetical protein